MACRCGCCCGFGHLNEDNGRFLLLALLIILYLLCGAAIFSAIEHPKEKEAKERWQHKLDNFTHKYNLSKTDLHNFLRDYEEANVAGIRVDTIRPRWDFPGAFYFVGTVVSTIGFGMTTPATIAGKIFLIFYGLVGCAATILFFNLFLERLITVIAYIMKSFHERQLRRKDGQPPEMRRGSVIKQCVNWILKKLDCRCCQKCQRKLFRPKRNVVMPGNIRTRRNISIETDGIYESETDGRRMSGEMISMKDFLASNKVSLAIMQKQLSETANGCPRQIGTSSRHNGFSGGVGALAIMNNRLAETSVDR
ncbi:potassium channel subfamily K member 13 [Pelobates cultripes]|uniref:Potassium channel subfamily K member 13 n=1 Tax=Pelobates cultripes TaxID=61616 RepID=A0AAD1TIS9_PELCU|nr:potassium channel subfamily K member 13 [Pelobates cultripes]